MFSMEVFLSHSDKDRQFAASLAKVLRRHSIPVWYSRSNLAGAQQWHDEIGAALKSCTWFVVVMSPNSIKSDWVKHELMFALNNKRYKARIVPLLLKTCKYTKLSWTLSAFQTIDFTGKPADGYRSLLKVWGIGYKAKWPAPLPELRTPTPMQFWTAAVMKPVTAAGLWLPNRRERQRPTGSRRPQKFASLKSWS